MLFKGLVAVLAVVFAQVPSFGPSATWSAALENEDDNVCTLVLTGEVRESFYTHPMTAGFSVNRIEFDPQGGVELLDEPEEEYDESEYKGDVVITGTYVIRQRIRVPQTTSSVKGTLVWQCCSGDYCRNPEEWEFNLPFESPVDEGTDGSLWALILEAILWGIAMLLTPCVFPMVPMTISFFLKGSEDKRKGRLKAFAYGLFIVLLYTVPICVIIGVTRLLGGESVTADIFNWLSTHWLPNIIFFTVFMIFAASFFGAFEIVLPSKWTNGADKNSDRKGLAGVFFLALTLVLVSFSCTGPIVGTVLIKSTQGEFWTPMVTMLAFSVAFALPFTLFALFPSLLKKLPKSGGWLNSVKVVLGFIEVALGFKFLSVADQTYHWHLLDREVYLAIWIVCFTLLGFYLLGKLRFRNDDELQYISVKRLALAIADFAFVVYLIPGMWGAPLKALSGYLPPLETQDFVIGKYSQASDDAPSVPEGGNIVSLPHGLFGYDNIEDALAEAGLSGKPVFVDISGHGCVNCREMEARVWSDPEVLGLLRDNYVIAALYTDDKTILPESRWITTASGKVLKDLGRVNSYIVRERFGVNAQPNYALLDADGALISPVRGYDLDVKGFVAFLNGGLTAGK